MVNPYGLYAYYVRIRCPGAVYHLPEGAATPYVVRISARTRTGGGGDLMRETKQKRQADYLPGAATYYSCLSVF